MEAKSGPKAADGNVAMRKKIRDVWSRNESAGQKLVKFCAHTHAAKLVVEMTGSSYNVSSYVDTVKGSVSNVSACMFQCLSTSRGVPQCVSNLAVCDGMADCTNGLDENKMICREF